jgi:hypothetical protein
MRFATWGCLFVGAVGEVAKHNEEAPTVCSMTNVEDCVVENSSRQQPWNYPEAYLEDSIYRRDDAFDVYRRVTFPTEGLDAHENKELRTTLNELFVKYRPSEHSFFKTLQEAPDEVVKNPDVLRELYIRYQSAMHSTRVSVYFTPYLDTPQQRQKKVKIILDDDTTNDVISHHKQLENLFRYLGATDLPHEEEFGDLELLAKRLDPDTARFVKTADELYRASLGAWTMIEILSDDWISGMADGFKPHYEEGYALGLQYFDEIATGHVEIQHMLQTLALTESTIVVRPQLLGPTQEHARQMAQEVHLLWDNMENVLKNPTTFVRSMV